MLKLLNIIKGLIMKACRFILNSDYVTSQNDKEYTISVSLPSSFYVPANTLQEFKTTINVPNSASKDYRCYITSTAFNFGLTGVLEAGLKYGNDNLNIALIRDKNNYTLSVYAPKSLSAKTYSGTGQVITAHIMTFVDPFQA